MGIVQNLIFKGSELLYHTGGVFKGSEPPVIPPVKIPLTIIKNVTVIKK